MAEPGQDHSLQAIWNLIEKVWGQSGAWPEFTQVMRLAVHSKGAGDRDPSVWGLLPGLCCQAAGGQPSWADPVAAAWLLFYTAAHVMDSLEDQDPPDEWWVEGGPGLALNAFTGLFFSATLALQELAGNASTARRSRKTIQEVLHSLMVMSSGQFADFTDPPCTLEEYWRIASAKSGAFFALACRAGARLATSRRSRLDGYEQFGLNLGLVIQVLDDLGDWRDLVTPGRLVDVSSLRHSLPALYIREVCPTSIQARFEQLAQAAPTDPGAAGELSELIESSGGVMYLLAELEMRRQNALRGLKISQAASPAREHLTSLLDRITAITAH